MPALIADESTRPGRLIALLAEPGGHWAVSSSAGGRRRRVPLVQAAPERLRERSWHVPIFCGYVGGWSVAVQRVIGLGLKRFRAVSSDRRVVGCVTGVSRRHACPTQSVDSGCAARANAHRVRRHHGQTHSVTAGSLSAFNGTPVGERVLTSEHWRTAPSTVVHRRHSRFRGQHAQRTVMPSSTNRDASP